MQFTAVKASQKSQQTCGRSLYCGKNREAYDAFQLDLSNPSRLILARNFEMRPDDIVYVSTQPLTEFNTIAGQLISTFTGLLDTNAENRRDLITIWSKPAFPFGNTGRTQIRKAVPKRKSSRFARTGPRKALGQH